MSSKWQSSDRKGSGGAARHHAGGEGGDGGGRVVGSDLREKRGRRWRRGLWRWLPYDPRSRAGAAAEVNSAVVFRETPVPARGRR